MPTQTDANCCEPAHFPRQVCRDHPRRGAALDLIYGQIKASKLLKSLPYMEVSPYVGQAKRVLRVGVVTYYGDDSDPPPFIKARADARQLATREGGCYQHVQAIAGQSTSTLNRQIDPSSCLACGAGFIAGGA
jgi:hypothetical protein